MYFVHVDSASTEVLLWTYSPDYGSSAAAWRHRRGKGGVFCFTPGHTALRHRRRLRERQVGGDPGPRPRGEAGGRHSLEDAFDRSSLRIAGTRSLPYADRSGFDRSVLYPLAQDGNGPAADDGGPREGEGAQADRPHRRQQFRPSGPRLGTGGRKGRRLRGRLQPPLENPRRRRPALLQGRRHRARHLQLPGPRAPLREIPEDAALRAGRSAARYRLLRRKGMASRLRCAGKHESRRDRGRMPHRHLGAEVAHRLRRGRSRARRGEDPRAASGKHPLDGEPRAPRSARAPRLDLCGFETLHARHGQYVQVPAQIQAKYARPLQP
jgi:hypothetical protein